MEQAIKNLASLIAAMAAEEARKNSWGTWLLSPLYKKVQESEEVKAQKDIARQERRIEKDMKERRLEAEKAKLKATKTSLETSQVKIDAENEPEGRLDDSRYATKNTGQGKSREAREGKSGTKSKSRADATGA